MRPDLFFSKARARALALCACLVAAPAVRAAEYDPYWGWRSAPRDSTVQLNRSLNALLVRGLADVNERRPSECRQAARILTAPLVVTSEHFFRSAMRHWSMDRSPRRDDGRAWARFNDVSIYRNTPLFPFGHWVPLDPTLLVDDVLFGPDKIGHFFINGYRAWSRMLETRRGRHDEQAWREAMRYGIAEERGWLGMGIDGVFSFSDLHAMSAGVRWFGALCDDQAPRLARADDGSWALTGLFKLEDVIDPCWDESFAPSAFTAREGDNVARALAGVCPLLEDEAVKARRARYRARGCDARTVGLLAEFVANGEAPNPERWDIDRVCAAKSADSDDRATP